jgi:hypothetical protein
VERSRAVPTRHAPRRRGIQYAAAFVGIAAACGYWIIRRSLSSGAHSRDPLADDDSGVR